VCVEAAVQHQQSLDVTKTKTKPQFLSRATAVRGLPLRKEGGAAPTLSRVVRILLRRNSAAAAAPRAVI